MLETILKTEPPMSVEDVMDRCDGIYLCFKDKKSTFLWCNENFARLTGQTKDDIIGKVDQRAEHVKFDQEVMASGKPVLNLHESITVPDGGGGLREVQIVTQKGLLRQPGTGDVIGITVCFALQDSADDWITKLNLTPIELGGYFAPVATAGESTLKFALPDRFNGDRRLYSTNYYLLRDPQVLQLHSLNQDEQWFYHAGNPIRLHCFTPDGRYLVTDVGADPSRGQALQAVAPHGSWFGGEILEGGYGLFGCSLAPGWEAADPALPTAQQLARLKADFPAQAEVISRLSAQAL
ncbi:MAG: cupin domain-containing protein [Burkholderiaceae bacterium]|nr:cupin domain-containing protein [Burkholderiaceae bacterium]